jgi:uncharacterized protein YndB with AHSA1/START domain
MPPPAVFEAWSTQEGLETWFLRKAEFTKPDGSKRTTNEPVQKETPISGCGMDTVMTRTRSAG